MNKFEIFSKKNIGKLSAAIRDDGSVWFLAKDVAEILGMQAKNALRMLDDSDNKKYSLTSETAAVNISS